MAFMRGSARWATGVTALIVVTVVVHGSGAVCHDERNAVCGFVCGSDKIGSGASALRGVLERIDPVRTFRSNFPV